jgi:hypothetical protein
VARARRLQELAISPEDNAADTSAAAAVPSVGQAPAPSPSPSVPVTRATPGRYGSGGSSTGINGGHGAHSDASGVYGVYVNPDGGNYGRNDALCIDCNIECPDCNIHGHRGGYGADSGTYGSYGTYDSSSHSVGGVYGAGSPPCIDCASGSYGGYGVQDRGLPGLPAAAEPVKMGPMTDAGQATDSAVDAWPTQAPGPTTSDAPAMAAVAPEDGQTLDEPSSIPDGGHTANVSAMVPHYAAGGPARAMEDAFDAGVAPAPAFTYSPGAPPDQLMDDYAELSAEIPDSAERPSTAPWPELVPAHTAPGPAGGYQGGDAAQASGLSYAAHRSTAPLGTTADLPADVMDSDAPADERTFGDEPIVAPWAGANASGPGPGPAQGDEDSWTADYPKYTDAPAPAPIDGAYDLPGYVSGGDAPEAAAPEEWPDYGASTALI